MLKVSFDDLISKGPDEWERCSRYVCQLGRDDPLQRIAPYIIRAGNDPRCYMTLEATPTSINSNVMNICHGGTLTTWADTAMWATAAHVAHSYGCECLTQEITYRFIKPVKLGDHVIITTSLDTIQGPQCYVSCIIKANNIVVGAANAQLFLVKRRSSNL